MNNQSLLNGVPNVLCVPYVPSLPRAQVYFTGRKIKNIVFNEIKWRFVHCCFQGCWILIWTLIKISFFQIGSKNIKFFYAEGQNNTKGKDTLWNFSFSPFHEILFQGHFMKQEILSWNTFTLLFKFHCVRSSSINKIEIVFTEKKYLLKFNSIKLYLLLIKQKQRNSKIPERIWIKPWLKTRSDKSACANIFLELPSTN